MAAEHGPAPWVIGEFQEETDLAIVDDNDCVTCVVSPYAEEWTEQEKANARLIAAAPELLQGCKTVLRLLEQGALVRNISDDGAADWPVRMLKFVQELNQLTTAVAKAEGR